MFITKRNNKAIILTFEDRPGPAACAERSATPCWKQGKGAHQITRKLFHSMASLHFQSPFTVSTSSLDFQSCDTWSTPMVYGTFYGHLFGISWGLL